ncbi:MAG TPA: aminotransferase class V-fold PLP-dependent enzyme [Thermoanaerobaculia bacterium]|nr:aminotransferase class V-fold PLP-dependent enzyme [Thermoanaerobaculia bacterium]
MWDLASLEKSFNAYLATLDRVAPAVQRGEVLDDLATRYSFHDPQPLEAVVDDVERWMREGIIHSNHPRYFGLFNPRVRFSSVVGDLITAAANPQLGAWFHAPAAVEIEEHVLHFFAKKFGVPDAAAHFTSGGSEANLTAVIVAIEHHFPESHDEGTRAIAKRPVLFVSREAHHSFDKIAQQTGLGRNAVRFVDAGEHDRMRIDALERDIANARERGEAPFLVVATAGTTGTGAIDPMREISAICRRESLWMHVDAAWGGAAAATNTLRRHLDGIELADSITCDAHKWLSAPIAAGMFFTPHADSLRRAFGTNTPYVPKAAGPEFYRETLQWSRRFIGLKLFMALAELGEEGLAGQLEHHAEIATYLRERIAAAGWTITNDSPLAVVCFTNASIATEEACRSRADAIVARGNAWISPLIREGRVPALRACVTNFETTREDVDVLLDELRA